ncbi:MAG: ParA family protein [Hyphomonadaceae bacterium]
MNDWLELAVLIITIAGSAYAVWRHGFSQGKKIGVARLAEQRAEIEQIKAQLDAAQEDRKAQDKQLIASFSSRERLWTRFAPIKPPGFDAAIARSKTKVVTIGNLKGGVAKTTLSINLAAYFAAPPRSKRVLIIDLDYQGSATNTLRQYVKSPRRESSVNVVFEKDCTTAQFKAACEALPELPRVTLLGAAQDLDDVESKAMIDWFADQGTFDVRYDLARFLCDPAIRNEFDLILIDTPPRLTTGMINALCASTHLLIPTKLDVTSAEAVGPFWSKVDSLATELNPALRLAGVVGTLTRIDGLEEPEEDAVGVLRSQVPRDGPDDPLIARILPYKKAIASEAGSGIAYVADSNSRKIFAAIGDELAKRIEI